MTTQPEALRLADEMESNGQCMSAAAELRRLHYNNLVLTNALWKACGDDGEVVNATIESQGGNPKQWLDQAYAAIYRSEGEAK
jgi:hypothetical protein